MNVDSPEINATAPTAPDVLRARFRERIARLPAPIRRGARPWLLGFSHGADSTALLTLCAEHRDALPKLEAHIVDHGLRAESREEAERAARFATELDVHAVVHRVELERPSETDARRARYAVFRDVAARTRARGLLLAHHRQDQLETVLMRMLRGSGPLGLCGMPSRRPVGPDCVLLRPLLPLRPEALRDYLRASGHDWCEDPTNRDPDLTLRNHVRHRLLPQLRRQDPHDARLLQLILEARRLRRAVRSEVATYYDASRRPDAAAGLLALAPETSPWTREQVALDALEALGMPRPTRHLTRHFAALLGGATRTGARTESRGRWTAQRLRDGVHLQAIGPIQHS